MKITNQLHQIKIIPECIAGSSTPVVLKRPQQTWKTLKRVQGLTNFRPYQNVGQSSKGHFTKCWVSTQPIKEVSLSPLREGAVPEGFCPGVPAGQVSGKTSRGFTLIEILIVVLIIGILAAVALPQYQKAVEKSRAVQMYAFLSALAKAQYIYKLANGDFTHDLTELDIDIPLESGDATVSDFEGYGYHWHKCGQGCLYAYKTYKNGAYGLQVQYENGRIYCMADADGKALEICRSLGYLEEPFWTNNNVTTIGMTNYYSK